MVPVIPEDARDTPAHRRVGIWLCTAAATLALQMLSLSASSELCAEAEARTEYLLSHEGPRFVFIPWCGAAFAASILDHRGRYLARSSLHRWTWYHALVQFAASFEPQCAFIERCGLSDDINTIFGVLSKALQFWTVISWVILAYITVLKLHMLAEAVPHYVSRGKRCFQGQLLVAALDFVFFILIQVVRLNN